MSTGDFMKEEKIIEKIKKGYKPPNKVMMSVLLPPGLIYEIDKTARRLLITRSEVVRNILEKTLLPDLMVKHD